MLILGIYLASAPGHLIQALRQLKQAEAEVKYVTVYDLPENEKPLYIIPVGVPAVE